MSIQSYPGNDPVMLLKSLYVDAHTRSIINLGDCIILETAGHCEKLRVIGLDCESDKIKLDCEPA